MKHTAIKYYMHSIITLVKNTNIMCVPMIMIHKTSCLRLSNGMKFHITNLMDVWTIKETIIDNQYKVSVGKGSVVVDIGAYLGDFSIFAAKSGATVVAYEPNKKYIKVMKKNIKLNKIGSIKLIPTKAPSINAILKQNNLKRIDVLKIDCEGCEYELFDHNTEFSKIDLITAEIHFFNEKMKRRCDKLKNLLIANNFKVIEEENKVHDCIQYTYAIRSK